MKNVSQYSFLHTHHYFPTVLGLIRRSLCFFFAGIRWSFFRKRERDARVRIPLSCFKRTRIRSGSFLLIAAFGQFDGIGIVQSNSETLLVMDARSESSASRVWMGALCIWDCIPSPPLCSPARPWPSEKANSLLLPVPPRLYPEPQKTVPLTMEGPQITEPPLANFHKMLPVSPSMATISPESDPA